MRRFAGLSAVVLTIALGGQVEAALLTSAFESQLETWLGQGDLTFTNIFTKGPRDSSLGFHAAVDGKGATFTLIELLGANGQIPAIIGGYNPYSWDTSTIVRFTPNDSERTAFIYNLTAGVLQRQNLSTDPPPADVWGAEQTVNSEAFGPTFSNDLVVLHTLSHGVAINYSYGGTGTFGEENNIYRTPRDVFSANGEYGQLEVYTFSTAAPVPEPGTLTLAGLGALGVTVLARRRKTSGPKAAA